MLGTGASRGIDAEIAKMAGRWVQGWRTFTQRERGAQVVAEVKDNGSDAARCRPMQGSAQVAKVRALEPSSARLTRGQQRGMEQVKVMKQIPRNGPDFSANVSGVYARAKRCDGVDEEGDAGRDRQHVIGCGRTGGLSGGAACGKRVRWIHSLWRWRRK